MILRAPGVMVANRYRLCRQLGVGGMGTVWLADDLLLDSRCALKLIDDDKAQSEEVRMRFSREAKVAAQLRGAHVVDVFEHGEWEGTPFIAMEYLEGEDLGSRLDHRGVLDAASTYRVAAHVSRALARAHAFGIVHRDLKPENIFLVPGDDGEIAKVLDFGIAKHDTYSLRDKATKTGSFLGTPYYVSPEQARGKATDHRSDLWSLGVIVFQCLTGRPPFESEALGELMGLILYEDLPKPSEVRPDLPPSFDAWWEKAAKREREERFQSAKEFADSLAEALGQPATLAVPSLSPRASIMVEGAGDPLEDPRETGAPLARTRHSSVPRVSLATALIRHPRHWRSAVRALPRKYLAGGAVALGVLGGGLLTLLVGQSTPPAAPLPVHVQQQATTVVPPATTPAPQVEVVGPAGTAAAPPPSASASAETPDADVSSSRSSTSTSARVAAPPGARRAPKPASVKKQSRRDYGI